MYGLKSITPKEMRDINRTTVLEYVRQKEIVSRSAIASELGLSLSSVVRIIDELIEDQLIHMSGEYEFSGGRRRPLIEIDKDRNVTVSVDIGSKKAAIALCDITGNILETRTIINHQCQGEECVNLIMSLIDEIIPFAKDKIIRGIAIGVPGVVQDKQHVIAAPSLSWNNLQLGETLENRYDFPILIENDVNLEALGELWFGHGTQCANLIFIHIGTGLGTGIILDRCILRGAHNAAGELGYGIFDRNDLAYSFPEFGSLESAIAGYGLGLRAKQALLGKIPSTQIEKITAIDLFNYVNANEPWALRIVDDFIEKLSMAIVTISSLFDPEIIVLGGGVMLSGKKYLERISNNISNKTPTPINLKCSELDERSVILGGCAGILHHSLRYCITKDTL